ncbi:MAG: hypothetical protein R3D67_08970 [Hyphomicrobiaceae bacterium]
MTLRRHACIAAIFVAAVICGPVHAAPGGNGNGNGNAFGFGFGNGNGNGNGKGGGGGAPLPIFGVTLLGQAVGAGGLYIMWRRRRKAAKSMDNRSASEPQVVAATAVAGE